MKKITGIVLLALSCVAAVCLLCILPHNVRLERLKASEEQFNIIAQNRTESENQLLEKLFFDGEALFFDKENKTFYYSVTEGDGDAYNPYVRKEASNNNVKLSFCGDNITSETIRNNEDIKIIAYDEEHYEEYRLKCTTLPMMNIDCQTDIDEENKAPMVISLYDNRKGAAQKTTVSEGTIHLRGGSTMSYPKKAYKLSLTQNSLGNNERNNNVSLLGMRQDDDWILYPAYNDQEKIRNVFSANLWKYTCAEDNSLGVDNGMEYKYIELFMNGEYWGLYALGYPLDELQLEIDSSKGERLYKKPTWESETYITLEKGADVEGYTTKDTDEDRWDLLNQYFITLNREWDNSQIMYEGIDIDNAIDMNLFINMIQGLDHVGALGCMSAKNMYLSVKKSDGKDVVLYAPWDMDIAWGNKWTGDSDTNLTEPYGVSAAKNTILEHGNLEALIACKDDKIWDLIFAKYRALRQDLWSIDNINKMLDGYEADIYGSGAYRRDMERWPDGSYSDPEKGLDTFRDYVSERLQKLDEYYDRVEQLLDRQNIYITRSAQYEDFTSLRFIYEINDREALEDSEYREFIDYIGADTENIPENARYAVVDGASETVEYYEDFDENGTDTCIGFIENDINCDIYVDGEVWYTSDNEPNKINVLTFMTYDGVESFDFTKRYVMWADLIKEQNPSEWCDIIEKSGYGVVIEITNHDIIDNGKFRELAEGFGILQDSITYDTDFLVVNRKGNTTVVDNGHNPGDRSDTSLGEISVFYNEEGGYGVYLNGNDCIVAEPDSAENTDIRIAVMDRETSELVWSLNVSY
jgi:hypothetical protein